MLIKVLSISKLTHVYSYDRFSSPNSQHHIHMLPNVQFRIEKLSIKINSEKQISFSFAQ